MIRPIILAMLATATLATACDNKASSAGPMPASMTVPASSIADNTRINARDDAAAPTPMDQGNDDVDLKITQAIRKALVADDSLSMNAKNCKVITNGGKVVLRGPVASAQERATIDAKAHATPNVVSVDDQLEVKTN